MQAAAQGARKKIDRFKEQRRAFEGLRDEVVSMRATIAPEMLRESQARHAGSGMTEEQWTEFLLDYRGSVDTNIVGYIRWADGKIAELEGVLPMKGPRDRPT